MNKAFRILPVLSVVLVAACTTMPSGPSVMVLPGTGKTFDQFRYDDADCRQFAQSQTGNTPDNAAIDSGVRSAAVGTVLGAVAGAAINGGAGAGVGAGTGLALGGLVGTGTGQASAYTLQQRYDFSFQQCMYAKGHRVPVAASSFRTSSAQPSRLAARPAPPPPSTRPSAPPPPPPPAGPPPAPPTQ